MCVQIPQLTCMLLCARPEGCFHGGETAATRCIKTALANESQHPWKMNSLSHLGFLRLAVSLFSCRFIPKLKMRPNSREQIIVEVNGVTGGQESQSFRSTTIRDSDHRTRTTVSEGSRYEQTLLIISLIQAVCLSCSLPFSLSRLCLCVGLRC